MERHGSHDTPLGAEAALAAGWLRRLPGGTATLRLRGTLDAGDRRRVAVVGSRHPSQAQLAFAHAVVQELCAAGASVWSGGAIGIDAAVHRATLALGGHGVAVLPTGFEPPTPPVHAELFAQLAGRGAVLACAADGVAPMRARFLRRNAILVAAVDAVIVIAAGERSGSLHAAGRAVAAGVPLFAVPWGPDAANSAGCVALVRSGKARWLAGIPDLRAALQVDAARSGWQRYAPGTGALVARNPAAQALLDELADAGEDGLALEDFCQAGRDRDTTAALLLDLHLAGDAVRDRWGRYHPRDARAAPLPPPT